MAFGGYLGPGDRGEDDPLAPPVVPPPVTPPPLLPKKSALPLALQQVVASHPVGAPDPLQNVTMPQSIAELDDIIRRHRAALAQPQGPAYTPEQVQQRQDQNDREYNAGLMLQLMNAPQAQQLGGQIFKNALAARQPHITERGTTNQITGEFAYNPAYLREKDELGLTALESKRAQMMQDWEKARTAANEAAVRQQQHDEVMAAARTAAQAGANEARANQQDMKRYQGEDRMRAAYDQITKDTRDELVHVSKVNSTIAGYAGRKLDPMAQQSLVILLNKFLDPGSVVREGEFDRVVKAQGLVPIAENYLNKVMHGDILTPQATQQIQTLANLYQQASEKRMRSVATDYVNVARQRGFDPEAVVTDPRWRSAPGQQPGANGVIDVGRAIGAAPASPQIGGLPRASGRGTQPQTKTVDY